MTLLLVLSQTSLVFATDILDPTNKIYLTWTQMCTESSRVCSSRWAKSLHPRPPSLVLPSTGVPLKTSRSMWSTARLGCWACANEAALVTLTSHSFMWAWAHHWPSSTIRTLSSVASFKACELSRILKTWKLWMRDLLRLLRSFQQGPIQPSESCVRLLSRLYKMFSVIVSSFK